MTDAHDPECCAPESPTIGAAPPGEAGPGDDPSRASTTSDAQPREPAGTVPAPSLAAVFDREAVREVVWMAIGKGWNNQDHPAAERVTEAVWPLLEHAQDAAAGSHEGIRLWMLDCGELVAKHRERAEAAERKLATLAAHNRQHLKLPGSCCPHLARENLAIIGTEEEGGDPDDWSFTDPVL